MKYCFVLLLWGVVLTGSLYLDHRVIADSAFSPQASTTLSSRCLGDEEVSRRLETISAGQSLAEQLSAQNQLVADAKQSPECRKRIIAALVKAMDKPALNLQNDRPSFYLWHYGAEILASLEAEEALDVLIKHLDLDDGTPFPLNHHPALVNVIRMGSLAIPKLQALLRQSPDANARQYAVFCLASIGGRDAKSALQKALSSESNRCVSSFITASLQAFNNSTSRDQIAPDTRTEWYAAFLCNDVR